MKYNFDQFISRQGTNALAFEGYEGYLFGGKDKMPCLAFTKEELISMWVADMQFAAPPCAIQAMTERLKHPVFGYTMNFDDQLYNALVGWCIHKYNWKFSRESMCVSSGVIPALNTLVESVCQPDQKVLALTPSYAYFKHAANKAGCELVTSKLIEAGSDYQIDFADFEKKAQDPQVKLFFLCHPHNPTGRIWSESELKRMAEICFKYGVKIVSDEIHCDLLRKGKTHTPLARLFPESKEIITCMSVSKTFNLAGLMIATVIIPDSNLRAVWNRKHHSLVNPLSLAAAIAVYEKGEEWLEELKSYLDQNFEWLFHFLKEHLPKAQFEIPQATYLAWIDLKSYFPQPINLTEFFLKEAGVILEGAEMFVENGGSRVRLNLACPRIQLQTAMERIKMSIFK